jgi:asparagine synthetase B (glutamine-hydrolysing)
MDVRVLGKLDHNFPWNGRRLLAERDFEVDREVVTELRGAAAYVTGSEDRGWRIVRDPIGINKLFWVDEPDGSIVIAARPHRLVTAGHAFEQIRAVPRGTVPEWWWNEGSERRDPNVIVGDIRAGLSAYAEALASRRRPKRVVVALSGGLDSSGIAVLAREHFSDVVGVSFDLARPRGGGSEDRQIASRLARDLGIPLLDVTVTEVSLLGHMDVVLTEGIDWRDFNVHTGLVNAALAEAISTELADNAGTDVMVWTGDLANEFLVDYHPERYEGTTYYPLPRLRPAALRANLVQGLDTSHRETGIFEWWELPVVQPYAVVADAYLSIPEDWLSAEDRKRRLCEAVFGPTIPSYVYKRIKARAQVGGAGSEGGVLGVCARRGIDRNWLRRRFAELHGVRDEGELDRFVRAGRYRSAVPARRAAG